MRAPQEDGPMFAVQCWFCGRTIERTDNSAVLITISNLWRWADNTATEDDTAQSIHAHSACAKDNLAGSTMSVEPDIFIEDQ